MGDWTSIRLRDVDDDLVAAATDVVVDAPDDVPYAFRRRADDDRVPDVRR